MGKSWHVQVKYGHSNFADVPRSGKSSSKYSGGKATKVKKIMNEDCKTTVVKIASSVKLNERTVYKMLLNRLDKGKVCLLHSASAYR